MKAPLCRITYTLPNEDLEDVGSLQSTGTVEIVPGMTTRSIAQIICDKVGCNYEPAVQKQIISELQSILMKGKAVEAQNDENWRDSMRKIIGDIQGKSTSNIDYQNQSSTKYFQTGYDKLLKDQSERFIKPQGKQNVSGIYERSIAKRKKTQQKLQKLKKKNCESEIGQCTFTPDIRNTMQFFTKKKPTFFKDKIKTQTVQNIKKSTFEKLYQNSFAIQEKKKNRLRTLESQEQMKLSQLSFIPKINSCSRQICKMKSYSSFIFQSCNDSQQKECINIDQKLKSNLKKQQKHENYTFQPEISQNTKKMTKNLPNFFDRLDKSQQAKKTKQKQSKNVPRVTALVKNAQFENKSNKLVLRKQIYTIDDQKDKNLQNDELETQKKAKVFQKRVNNRIDLGQNQIILIDQTNLFGSEESHRTNKQNTSQIQKNVQQKNKINRTGIEMFNKHKKPVLQRISQYFSINPPMKIQSFSKNIEMKKQNSQDCQVNPNLVQSHPFIPKFIKQIVEPILQELITTSILLTQSEFTWALQTLFNGLQPSERGSLLGWGIKLLPISLST